LIDLYFLADVAVNFRSAYYDDISGTRITNSAEITSRYFRGWFIIDVLGILPISYIGLIINGIPKESDETKQAGSDIKALKVLRLFRLAKMLRLRKLKQLLKQYEDNGLDVNIMVETAMTLVIIALMAHVLACMYYFIGTINEENNNREVLGWVRFSPSLSWRLAPPFHTSFMPVPTQLRPELTGPLRGNHPTGRESGNWTRLALVANPGRRPERWDAVRRGDLHGHAAGVAVHRHRAHLQRLCEPFCRDYLRRHRRADYHLLHDDERGGPG
jgi:hypothetical protein